MLVFDFPELWAKVYSFAFQIIQPQILLASSELRGWVRDRRRPDLSPFLQQSKGSLGAELFSSKQEARVCWDTGYVGCRGAMEGHVHKDPSLPLRQISVSLHLSTPSCPWFWADSLIFSGVGWLSLHRPHVGTGDLLGSQSSPQSGNTKCDRVSGDVNTASKAFASFQL